MGDLCYVRIEDAASALDYWSRKDSARYKAKINDRARTIPKRFWGLERTILHLEGNERVTIETACSHFIICAYQQKQRMLHKLCNTHIKVCEWDEYVKTCRVQQYARPSSSNSQAYRLYRPARLPKLEKTSKLTVEEARALVLALEYEELDLD